MGVGQGFGVETQMAGAAAGVGALAANTLFLVIDYLQIQGVQEAGSGEQQGLGADIAAPEAVLRREFHQQDGNEEAGGPGKMRLIEIYLEDTGGPAGEGKLVEKGGIGKKQQKDETQAEQGQADVETPITAA